MSCRRQRQMCIRDSYEPEDGSTAGRRVDITVVGSDDVGVASIKLYIDGQLKSSAASANLSYRWDTRRASSGAHTILVEVSDTSGNLASESVQVYVASDTSTTGGKGSPGKGNNK